MPKIEPRKDHEEKLATKGDREQEANAVIALTSDGIHRKKVKSRVLT